MPGQEPYYRPVRAASFQPRFALSVLYLGGFFFLFALLLVVPALVDAYQDLPPGTEEEQLAVAKDIASEVIRPYLWIAIAGSVFATALGLHFNALPGLRR